MRLFVDESLSPRLAIRLNESGHHDVTHPLLSGGLGEPDHRVLARCLAEDRVLVTQNARDFRKLVRGTDLHPGLVSKQSPGWTEPSPILKRTASR